MSLDVLVATDGTDASLQTASYAVYLTRILASRITLLHVVPGSRLVRSRLPAAHLEGVLYQQRRQSGDMLQRMAQYYRQRGVVVETLIRSGPLEKSLCREAHETHRDLLVLGCRSRGHFSERVFGTVASRVVQDIRVPLLLVRNGGARDLGTLDELAGLRLLLPLDGSDGAERCLQYLERIHVHLRVAVQVELLHVLNRRHPRISQLPRNARFAVLEREQGRAGTFLHSAASRLRAAGYGVEIRSEEGSAGEVICRVGGEDRVDLVMMGRRRLDETRELLHGTVCQHVATFSPSPVWLVP